MLLRLIGPTNLLRMYFNIWLARVLVASTTSAQTESTRPKIFSALGTSHCCARRDISVYGNATVAGGASEVVPLFFPASHSEPTPS
jgi:hypothetical protein